MSKYIYGDCMFIVAVLILIALLILSFQKQKLRKEAVEQGFAEYIVNKSKETTWKWKETK